MDARLQTALARLPGPPPSSVAPLSGGITNCNYRLVVEGEVQVLRLGRENTALLGIDRNQEEEASRWADAAGVGAEVVFCSVHDDMLVTRFLPGPALTVAEAARPEVLRELAALLRRVHAAPPLAGRFSPFEVVRRYRRAAEDRGVTFPDTLPLAWSRMEAIEAGLRGRPEALCHNDLLAANFLHDGQGWRLIDWEYAAVGDPYFDLGNFAVNLELSEEGCRTLLEAYEGELRLDDLERLKLMRLLSDLREAFWGFLQTAISSLDVDYRSYAERHLKRFLDA